eukprot:COSAG01_NODE_492_length_16335_cov_63.722284_4_plen_47_part_00
MITGDETLCNELHIRATNYEMLRERYVYVRVDAGIKRHIRKRYTCS